MTERKEQWLRKEESLDTLDERVKVFNWMRLDTFDEYGNSGSYTLKYCLLLKHDGSRTKFWDAACS